MIDEHYIKHLIKEALKAERERTAKILDILSEQHGANDALALDLKAFATALRSPHHK